MDLPKVKDPRTKSAVAILLAKFSWFNLAAGLSVVNLACPG